MREAVICSPVRTPVGRMGGALRPVDAETLAALVVSAVIDRTRIDPSVIDDSILGTATPVARPRRSGDLLLSAQDCQLRYRVCNWTDDAVPVSKRSVLPRWRYKRAQQRLSWQAVWKA